VAIENLTEEQIAGGLQEPTAEQAPRDLVSAYDRLAKLENRVESMEESTERAFDRQARNVENRTWTAHERLAALENRMESMTKLIWESVEKLTKDQRQALREQGIVREETIRCMEWQKRMANELQDLRVARERAAMDLLLANARQDTLERCLEKIRQDTVEKLENLVPMTNEIAAELQALHVAQEQASSDLVSANDRQASVESRTQAIEKLMKDQAEALRTVAEQAASDFVLTDYRQARLVNRMETIEKLTKEQMAATASLEIRFEVEKVTEEQIDELQTATEQAARETVWTILCLENRMEAIEKFTKDQVEKLMQATASLENRSESVEKKLEEQIAGGLASPMGWSFT